MASAKIGSHVNVGKLRAGQTIRMPHDGSLWKVISANDGSTLVSALFRKPAQIRTRKGKVKDIMRRPPPIRIATTSVVEILDIDPRNEREIKMASATVYVRTDKQFEKGINGQGKLVLDALTAAGGSATAEQLATATKDAFPGSKQDSTRIVKFYMAKYTRTGHLKQIKPEVAAPAAEASTAAGPTPVAEPIAAE